MSPDEQILVLERENARLREALSFYADPNNWLSRCLHIVPAGEPNAGASTWETGPAIDHGEHARLALEPSDHPGRSAEGSPE